MSKNLSSLELIRSDLFRYRGDFSFISFMKSYIKNTPFRWQVAFRMVNSKNIIARFLGNFLWMINLSKTRIQIPKNTKIGAGLYIAHEGYVVINPTAIIGNNVNLSQFVTIGANNNKAAIIGDNVYIGPNVCIVEHVVIGKSVTIGAGSVVTKDIPDNATAAGNYAKVLNFNNPARYIKNKYEKFEGTRSEQ